jgi:hypothetical protein
MIASYGEICELTGFVSFCCERKARVLRHHVVGSDVLHERKLLPVDSKYANREHYGTLYFLRHIA